MKTKKMNPEQKRNNRTLLWLVFASLLFTSGSTFADGEKEFRRLSKREAARLLQQYRRNESRESRMRALAEKQKLDNLADNLKREQAALRIAIERDGRGIYAEARKLLLAAQDPNIDAARRAAIMRELDQNFGPRVQRIIAPQARALARGKVKAMHFARKNLPHYKVTGGRFGQIVAIMNSEPASSEPGDIEMQLSAPFTFSVQENGGCNDCTWTDLSAGSMHADRSNLFVGWGANRAGVAEAIEVPAGYDTLRVTATVEIDTYSAETFSDLIGVGQASTSAVLEVFGENEAKCTVIDTKAYVLAPMIWYAKQSGEGVALMECEVDVDQDGGEYLISALVEAQTFSVGTSFGTARITGNVADLKVEMY